MKHTVEEIQLKNGARGLLIDVPGATVMSFRFHFRAGNRFVKRKEIYEAAHLMEHMSFGANAQYPDEQAYEAEFTKNGAYHNAYTSDTAMCYIAECADFEWQRILDLQKVAICEPRFNETEMNAEKGNVRSELTGYLNNHGRILWPRVQQMLGEDIYTYDQRLKTIDAITLDDIKEHHKRTHTSKNMRFLVAGQVEGRKQTIIDQLESWTLPEGTRFEPVHEVMKSAEPEVIQRNDATNIQFGASIVIPRVLTDEEDDAMGCLNHILTGTMRSRIYGAARKKGLAYGMFSEIGLGFYESAWDFGGQVNHDTAGDLFKIVERELIAVKQGKLAAEELEAAKSYALGRHQMGAQTVGQVSKYYMGRYFSDDFVRDYDNAPNEINSISHDCIIETAQEFLQPGNAWAFAGVTATHLDDIARLHASMANVFAANT